MAKKSEQNEKTYFSVKGMKLANVRSLSESVTAFSLLGNGLGLYNLRVVDGKKGKFIGAPQTKGKDGEYYAQYAVYLTDEDQAKIIKAVEAKLKEAEEKKPEDIDF